jgi:NADPH:quinone reductase-like Zn-dependent oxidoreductase
MKAALRERYGRERASSRCADIEKPRPVEDQVLVRVRAASVNRGDLDGLTPRPQFVRLFIGIRGPRQPRSGWTSAGESRRSGRGVTPLQARRRVFGDMFLFGAGSFAEYVCAPSARSCRSRGHDLRGRGDAAAFGESRGAGPPAPQRSTIKAGDRVLIDGASGNVGPFAVQIAKAMGAEVTGVARTEKLDSCARWARTTSSTTRRRTTPRRQGATTGSSTRTRTTRCSQCAVR